MRNQDVVSEWVNELTTNKKCPFMKGYSVSCSGNILKSYDTIIGYWDYRTNTWYVNGTRYTNTTSKAQYHVRRVLESKGIPFVVTTKVVPIGCKIGLFAFV